MKLLFFVTEDWYFVSHRMPLAIAAKKKGYDVIVATKIRKHGDIIQGVGIQLIPFEISRSSMNPLKELYTILRLIKLYRQVKPDIVHHVALKPVIYGTLAARMGGQTCIINALAGMGWLFTSSGMIAHVMKYVVQKIYRLLLSQTHVIIQNPDDAKLMSSIGINKLHIIRGSGVDTSQFHPKKESDGLPLVILPARMLWDKGVGEFVEAARQLKYKGINARFALVGKPDYENPSTVKYYQLIDWQKKGIIEYWGQMDNMPEVYSRANIVCLPSYREGLPKTLIEAAACGRSIITTDVPGCREVVHTNGNGILVAPRDVEALVNALVLLIHNPKLRRQMGAKGRILVEQEFSLEKIIKQTLELYCEATN